jgi:hypothetical protein
VDAEVNAVRKRLWEINLYDGHICYSQILMLTTTAYIRRLSCKLVMSKYGTVGVVITACTNRDFMT